jgi:hypothetical protein
MAPQPHYQSALYFDTLRGDLFEIALKRNSTNRTAIPNPTNSNATKLNRYHVWIEAGLNKNAADYILRLTQDARLAKGRCTNYILQMTGRVLK